MQVQNKWLFLFFFILSVILTTYYFYSRPYSFVTPTLEVRAAFPNKPTEQKISAHFSNTTFGAVQFYLLSKPGITYILSITEVNSKARQNLTEEAILSEYYNDINLLEGVTSKSVQPIFFNDYIGQTLSFINKDKILFGQYFLTTTAVVAIYIRQEGSTLSTEGRIFVDSLQIIEQKGEFD